MATKFAYQKELLASVAHELPHAAFFVVDENLEYVLAGGEGLAMTGYTPEQFIGRTVRDMVPSESAMQAEADYRGVFAGVGFVRQHAVEGRDFESRGRLIEFSEDERYALALSYDVTERRSAEQAALRALQEAGLEKDRFLALLGHELRNPLSAVANALELMRRCTAGPGAERAYQVAGRQLAQLGRMVDDLQRMTGMGHGQSGLRLARTRMRDLVEDVAAAACTVAEAKEQMLTLVLPDDPVEMHVDPVRIVQVLNNVLGNAVKYTPPGGRIALSLVGEGDACRIVVADSGIGMSAETLAGVFELFRRGDHAAGEADHGFGIGMWVAAQFVHEHGGTILAASDGVHKGSRFTIWLPSGPDGGVSAPA